MSVTHLDFRERRIVPGPVPATEAGDISVADLSGDLPGQLLHGRFPTQPLIAPVRMKGTAAVEAGAQTVAARYVGMEVQIGNVDETAYFFQSVAGHPDIFDMGAVGLQDFRQSLIPEPTRRRPEGTDEAACLMYGACSMAQWLLFLALSAGRMHDSPGFQVLVKAHMDHDPYATKSDAELAVIHRATARLALDSITELAQAKLLAEKVRLLARTNRFPRTKPELSAGFCRPLNLEHAIQLVTL